MIFAILTKDKEGRSDDLTFIFTMGDHVTATILTKGKEGRAEDLSAIFAMGDHGSQRALHQVGTGRSHRLIWILPNPSLLNTSHAADD